MSLAPYFKPEPETLEIGVDEVGRGPLFGRVYTAAVVLPKSNAFDHARMKDSKRFHSTKKIEEAAEYIKTNAVAWAVTFEDERAVDELNILQATQRCMHRCISDVLGKIPDPTKCLLLIDGNYFNPYDGLTHECIEGGDNKYSAIAAASILAKVERDAYILDLCVQHPELKERYNLDKNKGYGTKQHLDGIKKYGGTQWHRQTFGLLKQYQKPVF
jgi:ribonuclease HII